MRIAQLPLTALRAFDATARHGSFTKAAAELNVTPGAVARQVHGLEDRLGVQLVHRNGPQLTITNAGMAALPALQSGFSGLSAAVEQIENTANRPSLTLCVDASFAALWLTPRLLNFREIYPECEIRIISLHGSETKLPEYIDVVITYSDMKSAGMKEYALFKETMRPYVSRGFYDENQTSSPEILLSSPLICINQSSPEMGYPGWPEWLQKNAIEGKLSGLQVHVELVILGLQACLSGQGYALISDKIVEECVNQGQLIAPFADDYSIDLPRRILRHETTNNPLAPAFIEWIETQMI